MCLESVYQYDNDNHYVCSQSWTVYVFNGSQYIYFVGGAKGPPTGRLCLRLAIDMLQFWHWRFMAKMMLTLQMQWAVFSHVKKTNFNPKDISISQKRPTFDLLQSHVLLRLCVAWGEWCLSLRSRIKFHLDHQILREENLWFDYA